MSLKSVRRWSLAGVVLATIALALLSPDANPSDPPITIIAFGALFAISSFVLAFTIWLTLFFFLKKRRSK